MQLQTLFHNGQIHESDHDRAIAHVVCLPIALKQELRNSRDVREMVGLLSQRDLARLHSAKSMPNYCIDVVRSYVYKAVCHADRLENGAAPRNRSGILGDLGGLEQVIRNAKFLTCFEIAPGFLRLLNSGLVIVFLLLPFLLAETSGT